MKRIIFLFVVVAAAVVISLCADATTIHVGLGGGYTYNTIQDGISAASNGDTVLVHDGTYTGTGNRDIDFGGRIITVRSENGAGSTVIDCEHAARAFNFHSGETASSVLEGFTICNGQGPTSGSQGGTAGGGGIYCTGSSPTIQHCVFTGNDAGLGGGINAQAGSNVSILGCTFDGNTGGYAGGGFWGHSSEITIAECIFTANSADAGGGAIRIDNSVSVITNCLLFGNSSTATSHSVAGGIQAGGTMSVVHCTFADNVCTWLGAAMYGGEDVSIVNSIFWDNGPDQIYEDLADSYDVTYSDVQDGTGEAWFDPLTCLDADPLFTAGYHLAWGSPCISSGTDAGVYTDLDGNVRPFGAGFEMGAYEAIPEPSVLAVLGLGILLAARRLRRQRPGCGCGG